jgi:hypothetical protein
MTSSKRAVEPSGPFLITAGASSMAHASEALLTLEDAAEIISGLAVCVPVVEAIRSTGSTTLEAITEALNQRGIRSARGGKWHVSARHQLPAAYSDRIFVAAGACYLMGQTGTAPGPEVALGSGRLPRRQVRSDCRSAGGRPAKIDLYIASAVHPPPASVSNLLGRAQKFAAAQ